MDLKKTGGLLTLNEGNRLHVYKDSLGIYTIGVGVNVDKAQGGPGLRPETVDYQLQLDLCDWTEQLQNALPFFAQLSDVRQAVLVDICHNVRGNLRGLLKFEKMLGSMEVEDWSSAAMHLLDSKLHSDVPKRTERNANMLLSNKWPKEIGD